MKFCAELIYQKKKSAHSVEFRENRFRVGNNKILPVLFKL